MILILHPTGNTFVRALLEGLEGAGVDYLFHTTLSHSRSPGWLPGNVRRHWFRRSYPVPESKIRTRPWREWGRLISARVGARSLSNRETSLFSVDSVYQDLDAHVARLIRKGRGCVEGQRVQAVYAYEDGALQTFRAARDWGIRRLYDLPIAYWQTSRRLLEEEARLRPDWEPTLKGNRDSEAKLQRKTEELSLAEVVVCPGPFVRDSLPGSTHEGKTVVLAPFGTPAPMAPTPSVKILSSRPLKLLFAGTFTQRKGLADLLDAMKLLRDGLKIDLHLLGTPMMDLDFYRARYPSLIYESSRPHPEVLDLMARCDILVLPSIVEGRALVQQEAMSCGLPLLVTRNAGAEDLVRPGQTGFLVPIRSPEALAERIEWFASHREDLPAMGEQARQAASRWSWQDYAGTILQHLVKP